MGFQKGNVVFNASSERWQVYVGDESGSGWQLERVPERQRSERSPTGKKSGERQQTAVSVLITLRE